MSDPAARGPRPTVVTVAVALWWLSSAAGVLSTAVRAVVTTERDGAVSIIPAVVVIGIWVFFGWLGWRVFLGSARARFWVAVLGALSFLGAFAPPYGLNTVLGLLPGAVAVLTYVPAARPFFPKAPPRVRRPPEPRVVAWDPNTGEPIREGD
ncbi:hypothetical protein [Curtobacterium sp. ISL-83]|uniref:hypothetical protein n=1 Tax=Curtobacterium sp. ISL-83 TaxID=2819145 RepID=UPI001BECBA1C|nr:hypothetical protein [Curtobacterium sp. ISL-83]MBT2502204.1 hypothetical protein [Curtobacterium sp. ISL-83]